MAAVSTRMRFLEPWNYEKGNPTIRSEPDPGYDYMNFTWEDKDVKVTDARPKRDEYSLEKHGFAFVQDEQGSTPEILDALSNNDAETVRKLYYPEVERLLKAQTGCDRVIIFDHTVRRRRPEADPVYNQKGREQPATMVHCDQSEIGATRRLEANIPGEKVEDVLKGRVQLVNVWRPLKGPVQDWPLAVMDYKTINQKKVVPTDLVKNKDTYRGQTISVVHDESQEWYYLKEHRTTEATLIKIWDNSKDVEAKLCAHVAFKHPETPVDVPPRESIEVRAFAIKDPENSPSAKDTTESSKHANGVNGVNGINGVNGTNGSHGVHGANGVNGTNGTHGKATNGVSETDPENCVEDTLAQLTYNLEFAVKALKGRHRKELESRLHNHSLNHLPDKNLSGVAAKTIDLLHEAQLLLEPGELLLADHFLGYTDSKCLTAAVEFEIPDHLAKSGPLTFEQLATKCDARADRLGQVMRTVRNKGIFSWDSATQTYANNHASELLLKDHWTQWRNWVNLYGNEFYDMARGIPSSCRVDATRSAAQINYETESDMVTYFSENGWIPKVHRTLGGGAMAMAPGILADYPWEEISGTTFLDVGGGAGALLALVLRGNKSLKGGLLDIPKVIDHVTDLIHTPDGQYSDIADRVPKENLIKGDFLKEIPSFEVYTMKWCLHDWDDSKALTLLKNIRKAIKQGPKSRLIVMESLLEDGRMGRLSRYGDLNMMVTVGGMERDEAHWYKLASQTGWKISNIYHLRNAWPCAIEMKPAEA